MNTLTGKRILVGPNDIAGFASRIAVALAGCGAHVLFFNSQDHPFNPHVEESERLKRLLGRAVGIASRWRNRGGAPALAGEALAAILKLLAFAKACLWAETCVMVGGKGFFAGSLEYGFLRLLGKRIVHVFVGTASRPRYLSGYSKDVLKDGRVNEKKLRRMARRTVRQARRIRGISRRASIVIENPLCGHFQERPFVNLFKLGVPLDVDALQSKPRIADATPPHTPGMIRILHCPSRPEIKGSARIRTTIERLIEEGIPLEFRQLTGIPHGQVLHEIIACDFVVDELYSDSPMAGFAAEASAFGKAAIVGGYCWELIHEMLRPEEMPPTVVCHPDKLDETIRRLTLNAGQRERAGRNSQSFLREQWSAEAFAKRFSLIVTGDIPAEWLFRPDQIRYTHGLGLEESEARQLIGALVERFGPGSLCVDHLPKLRDRLAAFSVEAPQPRPEPSLP